MMRGRCFLPGLRLAALCALGACAARPPAAPRSTPSTPAPDVLVVDAGHDAGTDASPVVAEDAVLLGVRAWDLSLWGACAVVEDRRVLCWHGGEHLWAPAGPVEPGAPEDDAEAMPGLRDAVAVCVSAQTFCALRADRSVFCRAQFPANDEEADHNVAPTVVESVLATPPVEALRTVQGQCVITLAAGQREVVQAPRLPTSAWTRRAFVPLEPECELREGLARCAGSNEHGRLANSTAAQFTTTEPSNLFDLREVRSVAFGEAHGCAALADGTVRCWGSNLHGQLGTGNTRSRAVPTPVPGIDDARAVYAAATHTCVVRASGEAWCWGTARNSLFGPGAPGYILRPTAVPGLSEVTELRLTEERSCALRRDGSVWCWSAGRRRVGDRMVSDAAPSPIRRVREEVTAP